MPDLMTVAAIALKTTALIIVAGLLSIGLRRHSAALLHLLWTSALALSVLMPLAVLLLPSQTVLTLTTELLPSPAASQAQADGFEWRLWVIGCACVLAYEIFGVIGLARWRRHAHPLQSSRWAATLAGFDCRVRVLESRHIASPCTWGVVTPVLLLPSAGDAWSEAARRSALLHELAHLQRRDAFSSLIARLACVLHWYNPLVWFAAARARNLQERACDDAVLRAGAIPSDYAQFLLVVAANMSGAARPHSPAIGMAHSSLRARLVAILDPRAARSQPRHASVLAYCSVLFAIAVLLGVTSIAATPEEPAPAPAAAPAPEPAPRPAQSSAPRKPPTIARVPRLPKIPRTPRVATLPVPPVPPVPPTLPARPES
jgi:beta-lactamase regulating signal transducer with metallopeptidase domain